MSPRRPPYTALRLLLLALVAFGLVAKPLLASACDIADLQLTTLPAGAAVAATPPDAGGADGCPMQHCGQCCVHVAAVAPAVRASTIEPGAPAPVPSLARLFRPTPYPVALRPPIAA